MYKNTFIILCLATVLLGVPLTYAQSQQNNYDNQINLSQGKTPVNINVDSPHTVISDGYTLAIFTIEDIGENWGHNQYFLVFGERGNDCNELPISGDSLDNPSRLELRANMSPSQQNPETNDILWPFEGDVCIYYLDESEPTACATIGFDLDAPVGEVYIPPAMPPALDPINNIYTINNLLTAGIQGCYGIETERVFIPMTTRN